MKRSPISRRKPLRPGKGLRSRVAPRRRVRIKPVNPDRKARNFRLAYGSHERVEWLLGFPCATCGRVATDPSHVVAKQPQGEGGPDDIIPQCRMCHVHLHALGVETFAERYGVDLEALAAQYARLWRERNGE